MSDAKTDGVRLDDEECQAITTKVRALAEKNWSRVKFKPTKYGELDWILEITPPFPVRWPNNQGDYVFFAYAKAGSLKNATEPMIYDGEFIGEIWGEIRLNIGKPQEMAMINLVSQPSEIGVQGSRIFPPAGDRSGIQQTSLLANLVRAQKDPAEVEKVGRFYREWRSKHQKISEGIERKIPGFASWAWAADSRP